MISNTKESIYIFLINPKNYYILVLKDKVKDVSSKV